jgi:hypothetical protein
LITHKFFYKVLLPQTFFNILNHDWSFGAKVWGPGVPKDSAIYPNTLIKERSSGEGREGRFNHGDRVRKNR